MEIVEGENVLNVTLREAENWNYTVRAINSTAGVINDNLASGTVTEGESTPKFFFPRFILKGTTLYCSKTGATWYSDVITPDKDDYVYDVTYNQTTVANVAFYSEGEDVAGVTKGSNEDRASMGKMGHTGGADTYKEVTTLTPGKYRIYMRTQNGNSDARPYNFKVGENVVFTGSFPNGTNTDANSDEFTVYENSTLSFASVGSSKSGIDYFYLVKTGEVATIGSMGYTTFSSSYPLNLSGMTASSGTVTAYSVLSDGGVSSSEVTPTEATGNVAAGEGLILSGTAGATITIPVATSGDEISGNLMKGCPSGATITSSTANYANFYVLVNGTSEAVFKNLQDWIKGGNSVTIPEGKAYLDATGTSGANQARGLRISWGGITGVENVEAAEATAKKNGAYLENGKIAIYKDGKKFNAAGAKLY